MTAEEARIKSKKIAEEIDKIDNENAEIEYNEVMKNINDRITLEPRVYGNFINWTKSLYNITYNRLKAEGYTIESSKEFSFSNQYNYKISW